MYWKVSAVAGVSIVIVFLISGCVTQGQPSPEQATQPEQTSEAVIPADSPLAKIRKGMGSAEVNDLLGTPTDVEAFSTGKAWNPFYFGSDRVRQRSYYKGIGRIVFGGNRRVVEIIYDPNESGYR